MAPRDRQLSPHFFNREPDGSVRLRLRLNPEEAALIEEAAGDTALMLYIHRVLKERALYHIKKRREAEEQAAQRTPAALTKSVDEYEVAHQDGAR